MAHDDDPADDNYVTDLMHDEIARLAAENAKLRAAVRDLAAARCDLCECHDGHRCSLCIVADRNAEAIRIAGEGTE